MRTGTLSKRSRKLNIMIVINFLNCFTCSGILKASLTIPTSSFTLNLDDSDIPFIEDSNNLSESSKHQMTMSKNTLVNNLN